MSSSATGAVVLVGAEGDSACRVVSGGSRRYRTVASVWRNGGDVNERSAKLPASDRFSQR